MTATLASVLGALLAGGMARDLLFFKRSRRRDSVDVAGEAIERLAQALETNESLQTQVQALQAKVSELQQEVDKLRFAPRRCADCPLWHA